MICIQFHHQDLPKAWIEVKVKVNFGLDLDFSFIWITTRSLGRPGWFGQVGWLPPTFYSLLLVARTSDQTRSIYQIHLLALRATRSMHPLWYERPNQNQNCSLKVCKKISCCLNLKVEVQILNFVADGLICSAYYA